MGWLKEITVSSTNNNRFRALDGMRGIAALTVVLYHIRFPNHFTHVAFVENGYLAVDLFFILSGFVISASYGRRIEDLSSMRRFLCLRWFRVYPLHFVMLCMFVGLDLVKLIALRSGMRPGEMMPFTGGNSYEAVVGHVFLLQGLPVWDKPTWNFPSWSISCEFVAYLVFSVIVLPGVIRSKVFFAVGTIVAVGGYCALALARNTLDVPQWGIVRCLGGFFFGMLIFEFAAGALGKRLSAQPTALISGCETAVVIAMVLTMTFVTGAAMLLILPIFIIAVLVLQLDRGPIARILMSPGIQFLGRISYSIYMVHAFILVVLTIGLKRILDIPVINDPVTHAPVFQINIWFGDALVLGTVLAVLVISAVTNAFIEEPARHYGRRLVTSSKGQTWPQHPFR